MKLDNFSISIIIPDIENDKKHIPQTFDKNCKGLDILNSTENESFENCDNLENKYDEDAEDLNDRSSQNFEPFNLSIFPFYMDYIASKFSFSPKKETIEKEYYCNICFDNNIRYNDIVKLENCTENHYYCKECIRNYFSLKVRDGITSIQCPEYAQCLCYSNQSEARMYLDEKDYKLFTKLSILNENPNFRECPVCENLINFTHCHSDNSLNCEKCNETVCYYHSNAHKGISCEVYNKKIANEIKLNEKYIKKYSKPCPHCQALTEKNGGCNHM